MKHGEHIEVTVEALGYEGISIGRIDGRVVQMRGCLPGERVHARVHRVRRTYVEAELLEVLEPSQERRTPPCVHASDCGGCSWQFVSYQEQLRWKQQHVRGAFERIAKVAVDDFRPIVPSPGEFGYRAKMEFTFADRTWIPRQRWESLEPTALERKRPALGLHVRGRYDAVLAIEKCLLQDDSANTLLRVVYEHVLQHGISCYSERTHQGFLRNLIIRRSTLGEMMVIIVTQSPQLDCEKQFLEWIAHKLPIAVPGITSVVWALNDTPSPVPQGQWNVLAGSGYICERIYGIELRISPQSFFQANLALLEKFVQCVTEAVAATPKDVVWDLYCGIGTLTLPLAGYCRQIFGLESNDTAIRDAQLNAQINRLTNTQFLTADLHTRAGWELLEQLPLPEIVVIDPPRAGMHPILVENILQRQPHRIVYVSCNPMTQARDVAHLAQKYHVRSVQALDMFPQTYHVESIAVLERD